MEGSKTQMPDSLLAASIFKENMSGGFGRMAIIFNRVVYLSLQIKPLKRPLVGGFEGPIELEHIRTY